MANGLQQDVFHNRFGGVRRSAWGGGQGVGQGGGQGGGSGAGGNDNLPFSAFSGAPQPYQNLGLPGGPPQFNIQDSPTGTAPTQQDTTASPAASSPQSTPTPPTPSTPPAPTSAQVQQNPSAWAGSSFDPTRIVSGIGSWNGGQQPPHTLQPIGTVGANGVNSSTAPEILAARDASLVAAPNPNTPPPGSVPMPGMPGIYMTPSGATWNAPGANVRSDPAAFQAALRTGIQNQTPEAGAFLQSRVNSGGPVSYGNRDTEAAYLRAFGLV